MQPRADLSVPQVTFDSLVLAQFDVVKRKKTKWHVVLKSGIARLNNLDYVFTACDCEMRYE